MPMTPPIKSKLEKNLPPEELADFLRQLAGQIASGAVAFPDGALSLDGMKSLKIAAKASDDGLAVTVRLKFPKPEPAAPRPGASSTTAAPAAGKTPGASPRPRYKPLKKRMKRDFKDIGAALAAGGTPRADLVAAFLADSRLMTTYRGKGDAHYPDYLAAVEAFETAFATADAPAMARAYRELATCKKACHARHA